jgi:hypothetical protein
MRCAVVNSVSGVIINVILADPSIDPPLPGFSLIEIPDELSVDHTWTWSEIDGFIMPIEMQEAINAESEAALEEGLKFS